MAHRHWSAIMFTEFNIFIPIVLAATILVGVWAMIFYAVTKYSLLRRSHRKNFSYRGYSLTIRALHSVNSAARCKKCGDYIENTSQEGIVFCSCREVFIDTSYAFHIVGAKNLDNLVDYSIISIDKFSVDKNNDKHIPRS